MLTPFGRPSGIFRRGDGDKTRFGVMDRRGSADSVQWVETDCCYNYHVMNAWDHPENPDQVRYRQGTPTRWGSDREPRP
eukprot:1835420-Pyramimonas_sp.AAC.1